MIISQTPFRLSFVGGGSDLEAFWKHQNGAVLSSTIDKYIYVIVKKRFDDLIVLNYSKNESAERVEDIQHELIREALVKTGVQKGVEITTLADIPSTGSGLGSSSSVTVGLLNALWAFQGIQVTAAQLAQEACEIEIDILKKPIGKQDQYAAAYGGLNKIIFYSTGKVSIIPVKMQKGVLREFGSNILLFYTGITRKSSSILTKQKKNTVRHLDTLRTMVHMVDEFKDILESAEDFGQLGELLKMNWDRKKELANCITNKNIDNMYTLALNSGATGGKIAGAGGGGFLMLFVPREKQNEVREAMKEYREVPFMLEPDGSKIIFNIKRDYWE